MVEGGRTPVRDVAALAAAGYAIVVQPVTGILAAAHALQAAYEALARDGDSGAVADRLLAFDALNAVLGLDELYAREQELAD
jgi:methylisocitrate lyase